MNLYFNPTPDLSIGDIVKVTKSGVIHKGVVVLGGILHNSPAKGEYLDTLQGFSGGQTVEIERPTNLDILGVIRRAQAILAAPKAYDALLRNCEHTVTEILYGKSESPQLQFAVGVAVVAGLVLLANR